MPNLEVPAAGTDAIQTGVNRVLDTVFQISAVKSAFVSYTVELVAELGDVASCELRVEAIAQPTVVQCDAKKAPTVLLGLINIGIRDRQVLTGWVPEGFNVVIANTSTGGGSVTLVNEIEITFDDGV